jgi:outer membrane biosynthesis protein TonB
MRADYSLYIVAMICLIIAGISYWSLNIGATKTLLAITLVILGAIFAGVGYAFRPKEPVVTTTKPAAAPPKLPEPVPPAPPKTEEAPTPPTPEPTPSPEKEEAPQPPPETPEETKPPARRRRRTKTQ